VAGDRSALREQASHIVAAAEIAEILNVKPNTINQWKKRDDSFPRPLRKLKRLDVWDDRDIREWAERTGRLPT
jgi:predicted DNA-binding transcriptional regulator AlpA